MLQSYSATTVSTSPIAHFVARPRVLLVEDNPMLRLIHTQFLEQLGYRVTSVVSGEAFLQETIEQFDAVLMDLDLPGINGITAIRTLFSTHPRPRIRIPVIACTSHSEAEMKDACLAAGMVDYLQKPISVARLRNCLTSHGIQGVAHE